METTEPSVPARGRGVGYFRGGPRAKSAGRKAKESKAKEAEIKQQAAAMNPNPAPKLKQHFIDAGKSFFNKFVDGFRKPERANVIGTFDDTSIDRMATPYVNRLANNLQNSKAIDINLKADLPAYYQGYIYMATGLKLMLSNTDNKKTQFRGYNDLNRLQLRLPLKLTQQIDQLGKTDLDNNNVFRLRTQNALAIKMMLKACALIFQHKTFNNGNVGGTTQDWKKFWTDESYNRVYSLDQNGVDFIQAECRNLAKAYLDQNWTRAESDTVTWIARLPYVNLTDGDPDDLQRWCQMQHEWTKWQFLDKDDNDIRNKLVASLIGCFVNKNWIKNRDKPLQEIDKRFKNTIFALFKPNEVFQDINIFCLEDIMTYEDMIDNVTYIQQLYTERYNSIIERSFDLRDIKFKEYGTAAQMVMSNNQYVTKANEIGTYLELKGDYEPHLYDKIDENLAGYGLINCYMKDIEYNKDWVINYSGRINDIRDQFIKSDFR